MGRSATQMRLVEKLAFVGLAIASACGRCDRTEQASQPIALPGLEVLDLQFGPTTQTPSVTAATDGTVLMTWQQSEPTGVHWRRRAADGSWTEPRTLVEEDELFVNWADFPMMTAFDDDHLVAGWLQRSSEHAYGIKLAHSEDSGAKWSSSQLHAHTGGPEYGFVSMTPMSDGRMRAYWLDGRESGGHAGGGAMQLRAATVDPDGAVTERTLVDDRVCDCCQTSAATTDDGPVVVYRDRSEEEVRDIAIAGPGERRRTVAADNWTIAGCPVNGPAVAASKAGLVVAWFTAAGGEGKVSVAFATDEGDFSPGVSVGLSRPTGRVDVEWLDEQRALVSFVEDGLLLARTVDREGHVGPPWRVAEVPTANASGFPRIARSQDRIVWAFVAETPDGPQVRVAEAPVSALTSG